MGELRFTLFLTLAAVCSWVRLLAGLLVRAIPFILLLILAGCMTRPVNVSLLPEKKAVRPELTQIAHFDVVDRERNVLRGGQPTAEQFALLKKAGVATVLKLNLDTEGSDAPAELLGMKVVRVPISLKQQVLGPVPVDAIRMFWLTNSGNVYVHCEHGQDRTGGAIYYYRRWQGWSKADAERDMLSHGFHKILHGLWEAVDTDGHGLARTNTDER